MTSPKIKLCPCGVKHSKNFDLCIIAKHAEAGGASVAWANEPDDFHHLIEFNPLTLRYYLNASPTSPEQIAESANCLGVEQ